MTWIDDLRCESDPTVTVASGAAVFDAELDRLYYIARDELRQEWLRRAMSPEVQRSLARSLSGISGASA